MTKRKPAKFSAAKAVKAASEQAERVAQAEDAAKKMYEDESIRDQTRNQSRM